MNSDSFFIKGKIHDVCQDYALNGKIDNEIEYAMISDGCSLINTKNKIIKHPFSDVSSRIICLCAKTIIEFSKNQNMILNFSDDLFMKLMDHKLCDLGFALGIDTMIADATLQLVLARDDKVIIQSIGDGVIVIEKDKVYEIIIRSYEPNYPLNLSYLLSNSRFETWKKSNTHLIIDKYVINKEYETIVSKSHEKKEDSFKNISNLIVLDKKDLKSVSVFSDGITDIKSKVSNIDSLQSVLDIIKFKNRSGKFVHRRCKAHKRNIEKENFYFNDDFSMASIVNLDKD